MDYKKLSEPKTIKFLEETQKKTLGPWSSKDSLGIPPIAQPIKNKLIK